MVHPCRIAVADDDPQILGQLVAYTSRSGHSIVVQVDSAAKLASGCRGIALDLIIASVEMLGVDGLSAVQEISLKNNLPIIALSEVFDERMADCKFDRGIFAHLMKPVRESELLAAIPLATHRYQEYRTLREEALSTQRVLEERKLIERAKGIIMSRQSLDEASAFRHLQQLARNHRLKMSDLAKSIILAQKALETPIAVKPHGITPSSRWVSQRFPHSDNTLS